ncbi:cytochrome b5 domain-containing protein [Corynebacterium freiburgense]|uniref:cytochrome b5 domain-containing protein n=1 Tax=Corynebacterium freiburgense TaxID=556548 RepID=UPI00196A1926|nr:cytochrome b5 domain-containing protein [Corynebacterium freiburgense]
MLFWVIAITVALVVLIGGFFLLAPMLSPGEHVGDRTKLERVFNDDEQRIIASNKLTSDELAEYNGEDGKPAYVAIDSVVYDVSNIPSWARGKHHGVPAGTDATEKFVQSNHQKQTLQNMKVVGSIDP